MQPAHVPGGRHPQPHRSAVRPILLALTSVALALLAGCAPSPPSPNSPLSSPLRLPTRAAATPSATPPPDAQSYYEAGLAQQEMGYIDDALQSFTRAIQLAPDFAPAYVARGTVYLAQRKLDLALADAGTALELDPANTMAYVLRGEVMRLMGWPHTAVQAFDRALELDPALGEETFRSRWLAACKIGDGSRLMRLSSEYADAHPEDPLRHYYHGWAAAELGTPRVAMDILIEAIEETPGAPALLWFALGHAYAENHSWREAVTSLEVARSLVEAGDTSLLIHSDQPIAELFGALGLAYLGAGRCVDAETMLTYAMSVGAPASEYSGPLEEAYLCQTATPTFTPYPTITPSS